MARSYVCSISFMAYSTCVLFEYITSMGSILPLHMCTHAHTLGCLVLLKITQEAQLLLYASATYFIVNCLARKSPCHSLHYRKHCAGNTGS